MNSEALQIDKDNGFYKDGLVIQSLLFGSIGLILSTYVLIQLIKKKKKPIHIDAILSGVTIVISLLGSIFNIIRGILIKWPYNIFVYSLDACIWEYLTASQFNLIVVYPISLLSLERCLLIIFNIKFKGLIWLAVLTILILIHFSLTLIICLQKSFLLSAISLGCNSNTSSKWGFLIKYFSIAYIIGFLTVTFGYLSIILCQYRRSIKSQLELNLDKEVVMRENKKILFRASLIIGCFIISYSGKITCWMYQWITGLRRPWTMDYIANLLHLMHNVVNSLIVVYMDPTLTESIFVKFYKLVSRT